MNLQEHRNIVNAALEDGHTLDAKALGWIIQGNLRSDLYQWVAERHFDNAPDRATLARLWRAGLRHYLDRSLILARRWAVTPGRESFRRRVFVAFGEACHTLADFYAHTNWVEVCAAGGQNPPTAPITGVSFNPAAFPFGLESGYFSLWQGPQGCRKVDGVFAPPAPFHFCHAALNKDDRDKGHGSEPLYPGGPTHFEVAFDLAVAATRDLWRQFRFEFFQDKRPVDLPRREMEWLHLTRGENGDPDGEKS